MLVHQSNKFWDNFLGIAAHLEKLEWNCADNHVSYALLKILIWEEAGRLDDKACLLSAAERQLIHAARDIEESCSMRRVSLTRLHERLPLIIDDVLRKYREVKSPYGRLLLKVRDELVSPTWKDLLINVESCSGKVVMEVNIEDRSLLDSTDSKTEGTMENTGKKIFWNKIDDLWSNFIWDIWYPFTDRFLGVSKSFELREYEFEAVQKYFEFYVARLIHYFIDVPYPDAERFLPGLHHCIELANKHLSRIRYKPELIQEELFDDNGLMIDRGIQRFIEIYRTSSFSKFDLGKHSAIVRRILYYNDNLERMEWSDLYLKVMIKNGAVVITLDEDKLFTDRWHEHDFNECFYNKQEKA